MNRFNFRIWDKEDEEMYYESLDDIAEGGEWYVSGYSSWYAYNDAISEQQRFIIMQSTGKKDKNNKLIYEEDILLTEPNDGYMLRVEWDKNDCAFIVKAWNGSYFEYKLSDDEISDLVNYEIIGNTYQNPELMRVESLR